jgi:hypothetical protein
MTARPSSRRGRTAAVALLATLTIGLAIAAAPVTLAAAAGVALAWYGGWPPGRLYRAAAWCLPMVAVWLAAAAISPGSALRVAALPYLAWITMWERGASGDIPGAAAVIAPAAIPAGLLAGGAAWSFRLRSMASGSAGRSPGSAAAFDRRQWRHQVRSARARISAPGSVPLTTKNGSLVVGAVIRSVGHPARMIAAIPYQRIRGHQVVIGATGTGKTTLLLRLWAAFAATALRRHAAGAGRPPLLVVLDCKGGADARRLADRARRVLRQAGVRSTAIWPDEASLSLWALPPGRLITTLVDLVEHGTGGAAYYADVMEAVVDLAVGAPCGPPSGSEDFLARLEPGWLELAYAAGDHAAELALVRAAAGQVRDIALRFRTLLRRLGPGLDGPGGFADADAWYCILEGTAEVTVAEAQARALVDLLASHAIDRGDREILVAVDEFSAVSRRLPIWQLYERARSLGLALQVSAQSWHGLAESRDERYRIAAAADGGIWLMRTAHPGPAAALAGFRPGVESSRTLLGRLRWGRRGTSMARYRPVVDPERIRTLDVGQAAYIHHGGVTYVQVKRLVAAPEAIAAAPRGDSPAHLVTAGDVSGPARRRTRLPDASDLLDEAFGPEPAR